MSFVARHCSHSVVGRFTLAGACSRLHITATARSKVSDEPLTKSRMMPFEDYLDARDKLGRRAIVAGVPAMGLGMFGTANVVATIFGDKFRDAELLQMQIAEAGGVYNPETMVPFPVEIYGMEPMIAGGLMATGGAIVGFFLGQFAFKFGWSLSNKTLSDRMNERREDFLLRIARHRCNDMEIEHKRKKVDDNNSVMDDYYGDSIDSLSSYREWVRHQQAMKRLSAREDDGQD